MAKKQKKQNNAGVHFKNNWQKAKIKAIII